MTVNPAIIANRHSPICYLNLECWYPLMASPTGNLWRREKGARGDDSVRDAELSNVLQSSTHPILSQSPMLEAHGRLVVQ